ncbi:MAG: hypothetical protein HYS56_05840 [Candidatus Omnitrophica bacterium]|nr:hypothetical protein [Candidatus Omnitrophota bacterium]
MSLKIDGKEIKGFWRIVANILLWLLLIMFFFGLWPVILFFWMMIQGWKLYGVWLGRQFKKKWYPRGKAALFIHSNSPNWDDYIRENMFPKIEKDIVCLNWSERNSWLKEDRLESRIFRYWGGGKEFNPLAIVFPPKGKVNVIRFWQGFKDFKHGKDRLLRNAEDEFFRAITEAKKMGGF